MDYETWYSALPRAEYAAGCRVSVRAGFEEGSSPLPLICKSSWQTREVCKDFWLDFNNDAAQEFCSMR